MNSYSRPIPSWMRYTTLGFAIIWSAAYLSGLRFNTTPSLPEGIWRTVSGHSAPLRLVRGAVVEFCPTDSLTFQVARDRGYIGSGWCPDEYEALLKPVVAIAGDEVELDASGIRVNGNRIVNSAPLLSDTEHRPLPIFAFGKYTVAPGSVWLVSAFNRRSFDSRYFGPIEFVRVRSVVVPLWVREHL